MSKLTREQEKAMFANMDADKVVKTRRYTEELEEKSEQETEEKKSEPEEEESEEE